MIGALKIVGFQCHRHLSIDLDQVTTIVGPSDAGKSAVIRALRWLVFNQPVGDAFILDGASGCKVSITLNGSTITRRRGKKGRNEYVLGDQTYKAMGTKVPETIESILNFSPLNFQQQHDAPYWFSETAGQVSRNLNEIVDLELIDTAQGEINKRLSKGRLEVEICEEKLATAEAEKGLLEWAPKAAESYEKLKQLSRQFEAVVFNHETLGTLVHEERELVNRNRMLEQVCSASRKPYLMGELLIDLQAKTSELENLVNQIRKSSTAIIIPETKELKESYSTAMRISIEVKDLAALIESIKSHELESRRHGAQAEKLNDQLVESSGGICPICLRPFEGVKDGSSTTVSTEG